MYVLSLSIFSCRANRVDLPIHYRVDTDLNKPNQIQSLSDEKETHEEFMSLRRKQQQDERQQFRKAWKRRRVEELERHNDSEIKRNAVDLMQRDASPCLIPQ